MDRTIRPTMSMAELLERLPQAAPLLMRRQMACVGCGMSRFDTLEDAAAIYGLRLEDLLTELAQIPTGKPDSGSANGGLMENPYTYFPSLAETVAEIPTESIVSRTIHRDDRMKAIVFAFAPGQELSEHTASVPAIIQIIEGQCELKLGADAFEAGPGAWARMPANLPHSLLARTPVRMLLIMLQD